MTSTATYPSDDFPAPPRITLDVPDGWHTLTDVAVPLAVAKVVPDGEFRPNVVVVITRVRSTYTLDQAVNDAMARLTSLDGYAEVGREQLEIGGHPGFRVEMSFANGNLGTMAQALRLVRVERGPVVDIVEITGSCVAGQVEATWPEIRAVQSSLTIGE